MEDYLRKVVQYATYTNEGNRYGSLNQDAVFVETVTGRATGAVTAYIAAVLDGHGMLGEESAAIAGKAAVRYLVRALQRREGDTPLTQPEGAVLMEKAFKRAHGASLQVYDSPPATYAYPKGAKQCKTFNLVKSEGEYCYTYGKHEERLLECGTTCTAAIIQGCHVLLAHVGDSSAVLGYVDEDAGNYEGEKVTEDHSCSNQAEVERVGQVPGAVITDDEPPYLRVGDGDWEGYEIGMTRALGHRMLTDYGLISEPEVTHVMLEPRHCCLILASDGVWPYVAPGEAVRLVMEEVDNGASAATAAEALVKYAVRMAIDSEDCNADNTTAAVFIFDF
uniref:PPM-type phosphatase domain-containing protein n=1 Tax=Tetraselmis chuii TaxID=63592 RepID=A0A7S1X3X9_9CHLO|mmetsp:Transcript_26661/g.47449  ORF Transcript_26661/g.47449 Transcript_26661/m.47449 type:complete len:335 (+) Transcript_26661:184-1188(+)